MWVVIVDKKTDIMFVMTREEREMFLDECRKLQAGVPSRVIAKFDILGEALKYVNDIYQVNQLIDKL